MNDPDAIGADASGADAIGPDGIGAVEGPDALAVRVAAAVAATPGVAGLDGGVFGVIATWLPGRKLTGVRVGEPGAAVEVGVVVALGRPIPDTVAAVRRAVAGVVGAGRAVDVTVSDIAVDVDTTAAGDGPPVATVVVDGGAAPRRRVL